MKLRKFSIPIHLLIFTFVIHLGFASAQNKILKNGTVNLNEKYTEVLDILFYEDSSMQKDVLNSLTIRFIPSFLPESQITILRQGNVSRLIYSKAANNVYAKINYLLTDGRDLTSVEIAAVIKVDKCVYDLNVKRSDRWINDLILSIMKSVKQVNDKRVKSLHDNTVEMYLDGAFYQIWFDSNLNRLHLSLYDENLDNLKVTGESVLAYTSNKLRLEIERGELK